MTKQRFNFIYYLESVNGIVKVEREFLFDPVAGCASELACKAEDLSRRLEDQRGVRFRAGAFYPVKEGVECNFDHNKLLMSEACPVCGN